MTRQHEPDQTRNLNPHRDAQLAMLVWGKEYAAQNGGSMDFYDALSDSRKQMLREWCDKLEATNERAPAPPSPQKGR